MECSVFIVAGLGNPGIRYRKTRHNVGFMVLDHLAGILGIRFKKGSALYSWAETKIQGNRILLVKPQTYMNRSGAAVHHVLKRLSASPECLLILCDDFHLPLGRLRIKRQGSHGGQKGLASVTEVLGTDLFPRMRLGIGSSKGETVKFVLSKFQRAEKADVRSMIRRAGEAVLDMATEGIDHAMNRYNSEM